MSQEYYIERFDFSELEKIDLEYLPALVLQIIESGYFSNEDREIYSKYLNRKDINLQQQLIIYMTPFIEKEYEKSITIPEDKILGLINRITSEQSTYELGNLTTKGLELNITYRPVQDE